MSLLNKILAFNIVVGVMFGCSIDREETNVNNQTKIVQKVKKQKKKRILKENEKKYFEDLISNAIKKSQIEKDYLIIIKKSKHKLKLYKDGKLEKEYKIALGFDPVFDKQVEGDGRTPEGDFYICLKNPNSSFHKSMIISYPNKEDAKRGLENKLINESLYEKIINALENGRCPPQKTELGGEIAIHGGGIGYDWTLGCVALENDDIEEIFSKVKIGTRVIITY